MPRLLSLPEPVTSASGTAFGTRAADAVIAALVDAGVDTFFGVPGGPVSPLVDAILVSGRARFIESRHEAGAAFAAAGYHRASGRVAGVVVTAGPGATNVVTGVASAHFERTPMLVLAGDVAWAAQGGRMLQDSGPAGVGVDAMLRHLTRASVTVPQAPSAAAHALAALDAARNVDHPGPALLIAPMHLAAGLSPEPSVHVAPSLAARRAPRAVVETVAHKLAAARRPLLVVGAGARPFATEVTRLAEVLRVPVITTPRAKGVVSEACALSLRTGGLGASRWARAYTERGVDLALVLGTDLDDCSIGRTRYVADGGELVHVDLDPRVFSRNLPATLSVVADAGSFARGLRRASERLGLRNDRAAAEATAVRLDPAFDVERFRSDEAETIAPYRALADLEAAAGPDARFVTDIGEHMLFALHYLTATDPGRFTIHLGLGSMGSGIGSSVGQALGDSSRPVVCVCGDGGMQMAGMEVLVALKERLRILFAVFNDGRYNMVYHGYRQVYGRDASWAMPTVDFTAWASALGLPSVRIERPGELTPELFRRLTRHGPAVLDLRIDARIPFGGGGRNEALLRMSMLERERDHAAPGAGR